jgi:hypothetical protein
MKYLFSLSFACFIAFTAFCNSHEDIQQLVNEAEKQWNSSNPDKSFLSAGNSIEYGLGYLKKNKFTESLWYFEEVIKKDGTNVYAQLFAGLANIGLQRFKEAETNFSKIQGINASLEKGAKALLVKAKREVANVTTKKPTETQTPTNSITTGGTKPVTAETKNEPTAVGNKKGGSLVYGDYVLTLDYWDVPQRRMVHQQKGFFTLNPNGTYQYMGTTGKYSYNASTGVVIWQGGPFQNMGKNTTTFQRNKTTCEIDFEYQTKGGKVYYSGGRNL